MVDTMIGLEAQLKQIRAEYAADIPFKIKAIEEAWASVRAASGTYEDLKTLQRLVHNLAGSGGTYGFAKLGRTARDLDDYLKTVLENNAMPTLGQSARVIRLLDSLKRIGAAR